ncbi:MAG: 16S rRNA (guanine(966)-N(2))-methyltransferase RsmD [Bifidobacteriaceae bacterium]|jgi:16S rRNA (guanine966-N2)-methyltransferase|nr:16S rRNA (guanine(966)-N(2))-methyltransferase RsmD [Bifidobacteriaceae bacterium]
MTRIVAGSAKGRTLTVPSTGTRPTSDRVREAIFSAVEARIDLNAAAVLDLYAGSGALGLEAASRGAAPVVLVDSARQAARVARANAAALRLPARVALVRAERAAATRQPEAPFDLVLLDPPYETPNEAVAAVLAALGEAGNLAASAVIVLERAAGGPAPAPPPGWVWQDPRNYGDTVVRFAHSER